MAAAALAGAALWRASASVRHLVWASALAGVAGDAMADARLAVLASPDPAARSGPGQSCRSRREAGKPFRAGGVGDARGRYGRRLDNG